MKYKAHLVVLWCLLIPFAGSLLSSLGVLNILIAVLAGWALATITLPFVIYYVFVVYLGPTEETTASTLIRDDQKGLASSVPALTGVVFEGRFDIQMAGRISKRTNATVAVKDATLLWRATGAEMQSVSLVGCSVRLIPKDVIRNAENCLEIYHPDRSLMYKDNYMYLIAPNPKELNACFAALTAVTQPFLKDPKAYFGDDSVVGFTTLLSTLRFELKESTMWLNAFAARCFMLLRKSDKFRGKVVNMFAKRIQTKFGEKGTLGGMLTDVKISSVEFGSLSPKFYDVSVKMPSGEPHNPSLDLEISVEMLAGAELIGEANVDLGFKKIPAKLVVTLEHMQGLVGLHIPCFPFTRGYICFLKNPDVQFGIVLTLGEGQKPSPIPASVLRTITDKYVWPNRKYFNIPFADLIEAKASKAPAGNIEVTSIPSIPISPNSRDSSPAVRKPPLPSPSQSLPQGGGLPSLPPRTLQNRFTAQMEPPTSHSAPPELPPKPDRRHSYQDNSQFEESNNRTTAVRSSTIPRNVPERPTSSSPAPSTDLTSSESCGQSLNLRASSRTGGELNLHYVGPSGTPPTADNSAQLASEDLENVMAHEWALSTILDEIHLAVDVSQEQLGVMKDIRRQIIYFRHKEFLNLTQESIVLLSEAVVSNNVVDYMLASYETNIRGWVNKLTNLYLSYWNALTVFQQAHMVKSCVHATWKWWVRKFTRQKNSMLWALCYDLTLFIDVFEITPAQLPKITKVANKYGRSFTQEGLDLWWEQISKEIERVEESLVNQLNTRKYFSKVESAVIEKEKLVKSMIADLWKIFTLKQKAVWYRNEGASIYSQLDTLVSRKFFYKCVVSKNMPYY